MSYWLLPPIWRYAQQRAAALAAAFLRPQIRQPLARACSSRSVGVVALVPYLVLQFKGLGIIVSVASYGAISPAAAIWIGAATVTIYVMISGMHGVAWNAAVKDALILAVVVFLGIYLPLHYYGGYRRDVPRHRRRQAGLPRRSSRPAQSVLWFQSTVVADRARLLHVAARLRRGVHRAGTSAPSAATRSLLPLYQLILLFVFFCGFAAILQGSRPDRRATSTCRCSSCRSRLSIRGSSA